MKKKKERIFRATQNIEYRGYYKKGVNVNIDLSRPI